MRILLAHSFYRVPGGEDAYVRTQMDLLGSRHAVELIGPVNESLSKAQAIHRLVHSGNTTAEVEAAIERFRPDVVHLHNPYPALGPSVHLAARRRGVPLAMTVHNVRLRCPNGLMFTEGELCRRCEKGVYAHALLHRCFPTRGQAAAYASALWLHRFVLRTDSAVAMFLPPSRFLGGRLRDWGIAPERIEVVPHCVAPAADPERPPGTYGLYLGRLSNEKGVDVLLRALAAAGDPPFRIAGAGPAEERLRRESSALGLRRTTLLGLVAREDVPELLAGSRYVVVPSIWEETLSLSALEAMSAGRAVIATRRGGLSELVEDGRGLAVEPGDDRSLSEAIATLARDDDLCKSLGAAARRFVEAKHTPSAHLERLESAYVRLLGTAS
ncbi:MAG: glycosyltransferase [Actinomycetota bacterium]|nr:glycosyltransferase [Actinomycetota bacterium]